MRSLKELFEVLRDNKGEFTTGLCGLVNKLQYIDVINEPEAYLLYGNIMRPKFYSKHYSYKSRDNSYYWPKGMWEPRKKWLDAQIKKLS
jgi:hypothetical protein